MKKLLKEFKEFALRGNVMDMAVGIIIGGAFTAIVTSLVEDILMPIIGLFGGKNFTGDLLIPLNGENAIKIGSFIGAIFNFILIALCIFLIVKAIKAIEEKAKKPEPEAPAKEARKCPYCFGEVDDNATRCPHCTSEIPIPEEIAEEVK